MHTLTTTATLDFLPEIMAFIKKTSLHYKANEEQLMAIELAVEEAVVNIISYAYPENSLGSVNLSCELINQSDLIITIYDTGKAYNPLAKKDPNINADIEHRGIGGLGVFLTKEMMDDVSYQYTKGKNILTLKKILSN